MENLPVPGYFRGEKPARDRKSACNCAELPMRNGFGSQK